MPPVVSGVATGSSQQPQPKSPPVVDAGPVASSSSPSARQTEAALSLRKDSFEFSLEVPQVDPVVPSSSGWSKQFNRSVRCKGNDSLKIVVPSSASRLGPKNNNKNKVNKLNKSTSNQTEAGGSKSSKQANPAAKPSPKLAHGVSVKSVRASSFSSSSSASENENTTPKI